MMGVFTEKENPSPTKGRKYLAKQIFVSNVNLSQVGLIGGRLIPNTGLKFNKENSCQQTEV